MTEIKSAASDGHDDRQRQVNVIVHDCVRRRAEGKSLPVEALIEEHRDLMPELGVALRRLERIERAAADAKRTMTWPPGPPDTDCPVVDGYTILGELGRSGQGVVYHAIQDSTGGEVAIKFLQSGQHAAPEAQEQFDLEIRLAAKLRHRNIITVFDSRQTETGERFYVMDFVDGLPLDAWIRQKDLALEDAMKLFLAVCKAVHQAHKNGVIHRDLKPANILVDNDGDAKILDFGLARPVRLPDDAALPVPRHVVGTLPYMSPEQARGTAAVDTGTDIYALGVILFELLTGQYPFEFPYSDRDQASEVVRRIANAVDLPRRPSTCWSPGSGPIRVRDRNRRRDRRRCPIGYELEAIVLKALQADPEKRYDSAAALARDIERLLADKPVDAVPSSDLYRLRKLIFRHRYVTTIALSLVAIFASSGYISLYSYMRQREAVGERGKEDALVQEKIVEWERVANEARDAVGKLTSGGTPTTGPAGGGN